MILLSHRPHVWAEDDRAHSRLGESQRYGHAKGIEVCQLHACPGQTPERLREDGRTIKHVEDFSAARRRDVHSMRRRLNLGCRQWARKGGDEILLGSIEPAYRHARAGIKTDLQGVAVAPEHSEALANVKDPFHGLKLPLSQISTAELCTGVISLRESFVNGGWRRMGAVETLRL